MICFEFKFKAFLIHTQASENKKNTIQQQSRLNCNIQRKFKWYLSQHFLRQANKRTHQSTGWQLRAMLPCMPNPTLSVSSALRSELVNKLKLNRTVRFISSFPLHWVKWQLEPVPICRGSRVTFQKCGLASHH